MYWLLKNVSPLFFYGLCGKWAQPRGWGTGAEPPQQVPCYPHLDVFLLLHFRVISGHFFGQKQKYKKYSKEHNNVGFENLLTNPSAFESSDTRL